jgi:peptidyl-prolyl cis-trans isomerase SurA
MTEPTRLLRTLAVSCLIALQGGLAFSQTPSTRSPARSADFIVAVVNNELVTQFEVDQRIARAREDATRNRTALPAGDELRRQAVESLINERVLITYARDSGMKVDDQELERAVQNIAAMNKLSPAQLRERLKDDGIDYTRFRANLRDQILSERVREREVQQRIRVSDAEVEDFIDQQRAKAGTLQSLNIAQILVTVPEGATPAVLAQRRDKALAALARVKGGEPFERVAREISEDANKDRGGEIGAKPMDRLPDLFVDAVKPLAVGALTPELVRSGAGFHILKLLSRSEESGLTVNQTHARHILLRPSARLSADAAAKRLNEFRSQILDGKRRFEDVAREVSEDGSAPNGGDLGWTSQGSFVPEFEEAMNQLPLGGISAPVESRFGVHLMQVLERRAVPAEPRQLREQARNALKEQKYDAAFTEWAEELRARAYIEMREPPQ